MDICRHINSWLQQAEAQATDGSENNVVESVGLYMNPLAVHKAQAPQSNSAEMYYICTVCNTNCPLAAVTSLDSDLKGSIAT